MRIQTTVTMTNDDHEVISTKQIGFISDDIPDTHTIRLMCEDYKDLILALFGDQPKDTE